MESRSLYTNEEIDIQPRKLAVWSRKGRFTVEHYWILLFESYPERAQGRHTHIHTHTAPSARRKELPVFLNVLSICFTF